ncbi:hypothetical protein QJS04_geneDACA013975 [Acorus gramineus]|uniref:Nitrate regulatory gene2 protein n=1 Tax=Acorus gramineus TaxID=55184 RepID=A0AAV9AYM5_ACOGR|nr:hypothetical protein QJS04_geneDACA013975 [Acorus gramineus]
MGCSASKLEDEEAVRLCKDRKSFIREAIQHRLRFASAHVAYIQSLKRVSDALCNYVEGDEERFASDSYSMTPAFIPVKRISPGIAQVVPLQSFHASTTTSVELVVDYMRSEGGESPFISVEERPRSPEMGRINSTKSASELSVAIDEEQVVEETRGFMVYLNKKPTSMSEVMRDIENQFMFICNSGEEVSAMLGVDKARYSAARREPSRKPVHPDAAAKMLNPVALFRTSLRSEKDDEDCESNHSEELHVISGAHQPTLDRLYIWEKKLYEEVKAGERVRIAYEKKLMQFRNQDAKGEDPSVVDRTRTAMRDLDTRFKISIRSIESVSKRIENLRDEELQHQLMELIQGLARMWRSMEDSHQSQKSVIDEAKAFLVNHSHAPTPAKLTASTSAAARLEPEVRSWQCCFKEWITEQRSYVRSLAGWVVRCTHPHNQRSSSEMSQTHPVFGICVQWTRMLEEVSEVEVIDKLDSFATGVGSLCRQKREEGKKERQIGEDVAAEKAEAGIRVLWAGLSVAIGSLAEFAGTSVEGYEELLRKLEGGAGDGSIIPV